MPQYRVGDRVILLREPYTGQLAEISLVFDSWVNVRIDNSELGYRSDEIEIESYGLFSVGDRIQVHGRGGGLNGEIVTVTGVEQSYGEQGFHHGAGERTHYYRVDNELLAGGLWHVHARPAPVERIPLPQRPELLNLFAGTTLNANMVTTGTIAGATEASKTNEEVTGTMSIAGFARELAEYYVTNELGMNFGSTLTSAADGAVAGKEARKLVRDFKAWLDAMTMIERADLTGKYVRPVKNQSTFSFAVNTYSGHKVTASLVPSRITGSLAMKLIESELPKWVRLRKTDGEVRIDLIRDGEIYKTAFRNGFGYYSGSVILYVALDGKVSTADSLYWVREAKRFTGEATTHLRNAIRESRVSDIKVSKPARSGEGDFGVFRDKRAVTIKTDEKIVERFPLLGHGLLSSRNWGIEVEAAGARGAVAPSGWSAKGDGSLESAYDDRSDDGLDHSIEDADQEDSYDDYEYCEEHSTYHPYQSDTREFVSPILHSYHSKGLEELTAYLLTQPQNDTAGVHVHVDVADLSARQIGGLVYGYSVIEPLLEASYRRTRRSYCEVRRTDELVEIGKTAKSAATEMRMGGYKRLDYGRNRDKLGDKAYLAAGDRYVSLNLQSLGTHGTVEFRAMGNVYEYEYLVRWAYIVREFVNTAKNGAKPADYNRVKDFASLQKLFARFGSETVDNSLSIITKADMDMIADRQSGNSFNPEPQRELVAAVGGEV